ncbi:uncharacterized protein LOC143080157 [Mytilus galloprovincialis]|uniref:uncharacterized protein LOC143080157 n=1 Tax=Mytilus galloprovincialis TaxID=29158 RepID=UPI003F7BF281
MDRLIHDLFLLSCVVCICAKVEWKIEKKISAYGEDLKLLCIADNYSIDGMKIKMWEGGPKQKMLALNGAPDQEDVMKYKMSMRQDGFDLVINDVSKPDLNVTYQCAYGFKKSGKVILKIEDAFEVRQIVHMKPIKTESKGTNIVIICVIIVSSLVIAAVSTLILLHKYRKPKELKYTCSSNDNSVHRNDGDIFSARCNKCKKGDRLDPEENEQILNTIEISRLQNDIGRQSSNGSARIGHSMPNSPFQEEEGRSLDNQVSNRNIVVHRNGTQSLKSDTMMNEHAGRQNSYHIDSASEQASGLTMNTFIDGSEKASTCENKIETKDRPKVPHSDSKTYNSLNADNFLQDDNSLDENALESGFVHSASSPQTQSPVPCDRYPDTIPKTMSDDFSIESVKELRKESLPRNNFNLNIPEAFFQSLQTVPDRLTDVNDISQRSEVPELPAANQPNVPDLSARNPPVAKEILKPQTRVRPTAKVIPIRSTSQEQQANAQSSGNGAEGYTPSPTTVNGIDIHQAVNNDSHKIVANAPYGEFQDIRENNTEDATNPTQGPPPSMERQQPSLTTTHESQQSEEINQTENNEHQSNLHQTASGNVLATPSSDNSRESESNQFSLQQETANQVPDTYSYP